MRLLRAIKQRLGPLWWYTLILLVVLRINDVISAVIGLYLVPKYVSQAELGAVLPLAQVGTILGLPLTILLMPFTKFLNAYATRGEYGKVKRLLRDVFAVSVVLFVAMLLYARFFMPLVFERMRVQDGRLGLLIVASGVIGTLSPVFVNAVQALKKFRLYVAASFFSAVVRLAVMLVALPIRGLSGYFVGQTSSSFFMVVATLFGLRRQLGRDVKMDSYLSVDWKPILKYTVPAAITTVAVTLQMATETFVIRQRLPGIESAGYYIISRFAEIGSYVGMTLLFVLFPLASEKHEQGSGSFRLLWQAMGASITSGVLLAVFMLAFGSWGLGLSPAWREYASYAPHMALLTIIYAIRSAGGCFAVHRMACHRFGFVWYFGLCSVAEAVVLYCLTGYGFFLPYFPAGWVDWMASWQAARIEFVLKTMFVFSLLPLLGMGIEMVLMCRDSMQPGGEDA
jgi:O-antigen/teichoic acid export membrane protein